MARPPGYRRLTRKARHLIAQLRHTRHASVQSAAIHELQHEIDRRHGKRAKGKSPDHGPAGRWRPLTHKAKQLLTRLRRAKVWRVQKQLVRELAREIERGRRSIDKIRQSRAVAKAGAAARATGRGIVRGAKAAGNATRAASATAQERMIRRAEARAAAADSAARARQPGPGSRQDGQRQSPVIHYPPPAQRYPSFTQKAIPARAENARTGRPAARD